MNRFRRSLAGVMVLVSTLGVALGLESFGPIVGYYKFDVPVGSSAWVCGLVKAKDHQGAMDNTAGGGANPFLILGGNTTFREIDRDLSGLALDNHFVEVLEPGPMEGMILDILSHTANTVTVMGNLNALGIGPTSAFAIREHVTLGDMLPEGGGLLNQDLDTVSLYYPNGSKKTFFFGDPAGLGSVSWYDPNAGEFVDDEVVYPGQGFLVTSASATEILIGRNGVTNVKETPTIIPLYAGAVNLIGVVDPLVATNTGDPIYPSTLRLADTDLQNQLAQDIDTVKLYDNAGGLSIVDTYFVGDPASLGSVYFYEPDAPAFADDVEFDVGTAFSVTVGDDINYQQPVLR